MAGSEGEKEFVILAVGEGLREGAALRAGHGGVVEGEGAAARGGEAGEVGGESVAEVHHGTQQKVCGEPAGLGEAGNEVEMMAGERAAEPARDVDRVAGVSAGTENAAGALDGAGEGDIQEKRAGRARGLAAHDAHAEAPRGLAQPGVNPAHAVEAGRGRRGDRDERMPRFAAHRGDVADGAAQRFPPDAARIFVGEKMYALDDGVGFQQLPVPVARTANDRAIIARSDPDIRAEREGAGEFGDHAVLSEVGELHGADTQPRARQ